MRERTPEDIRAEIRELDWKRSGLLLDAIRHQQEALRAIAEVQHIAAAIDCLEAGHSDACFRG